MGIPTVAFHKALLSEDPELVREVAPHVRDMVDKMLEHGDGYTHGENFNRAVILGLHLVAQQAKGPRQKEKAATGLAKEPGKPAFDVKIGLHMCGWARSPCRIC